MKKFLAACLIFLAAQNAFAVRVLILEKGSRLSVNTTGAILLTSGGKKYHVNRDGTFSILSLPGNRLKVGSLELQDPVTITPLDGAIFTLDGNKYAAPITVYPGKNTFQIVENPTLEQYLYGVLPYEMSYSWPAEALKAQAVAARTYVVKSLERPVNKNFDLYSDIRSQMYKGDGTVYPSVQTAVDATSGKVLKYKGEPFYAYYHADCGGLGTDPLPWKAPGSDIKPLQGVADKNCAADAGHNWKASFSQKAVSAFAGANVKSVSVLQRAPYGHATLLAFKTKKGNVKKSCNDFRMAMGSTKLKSCYITKISSSGGNFNFEGSGYGHGAGMSQDGAKNMAAAGKNFLDILTHYYPGAAVTDI